MSGSDQMNARRWSNRQRLVVLTFDTPQQAHTFDLMGGPAITPDHPGFHVDLVDPARLEALMIACRDVIDEWDIGDDDETRRLDRLDFYIGRLRRALFDMRQAAMA